MRTLLLTLTILLIIAAVGSAQTVPAVDTAWCRHYNAGLGFVDFGREIGTDAAGNVYVGGHSLVDIDQNGVTKIMKYDSNGVFKWQHTTSIDDMMEDMAVAPSGNVYYAGMRWIMPGAHWDYLLVKLNTSGTVAWTQTFNGPINYWDQGFALHVDAAENVYITGSAADQGINSSFTTLKYNSAGVQQWSKMFPSYESSHFNVAYDVTSDAAGNVYVSGYQFVSGRHLLTLVKYNSAGVQQWIDTTDTHGQWNTVSRTYVKADGSGNVYNVGNISNPTTGCDVLLVKYGAAGKVWTRTWNNSGNDSNYVPGSSTVGSYVDEALQIDGSGNVFVSCATGKDIGYFISDIVTLKYNPAGTLLWSHTFNGTASDLDNPGGIALDAAGNAYVTGSSNHSFTGFDGLDYITYKLNGTTGALVWQKLFNGAVDFVDEAHAIHVDAKNNVYVTGISALNTSILDPNSEIVTIRYKQSGAGGAAAVAEVFGNNDWQAYPMPVHNELNISLKTALSAPVTAKLINATGQVVQQQHWEKATSQGMSISTASLPDGMYTLRLTINGSTQSKSVVIAHH